MGVCVKEGACCPPAAGEGVSCGTIRQICGVEPMGSCVCSIDYKWHCFGTQDLASHVHDLRVAD